MARAARAKKGNWNGTGLVVNTRLNEYFVGGEVKELLSKGKS